ncbi:flavodoxin-dependent (E)-4-hydroxy-3-methylbut-2-enyl-diphosphate synthase [bacterium]|nr:flavodoxin-dependent (E)-4-hydroxy-3-methylbut-2-enyl-diphosphate synthase [bacterium]
MIKRRETSEIKVGDIYIGSNHPISIQSMTTFDPIDVENSIKQIQDLEKVGCDIVRTAVPSLKSASFLGEIKKSIKIPLVADIHFDYKIALKAIEEGVDGLRLNPGNISDKSKIESVVYAAKERDIPIRVGINGGSLEKDIEDRYGRTALGMVESALRHISILESFGFYNIKISLKASDIFRTVEAYRLIAKKVNYPLHIGITEAGTPFQGGISSAVGIGLLLFEGIGDTIRVSLTGDPIDEVKTASAILKSLGLKSGRIKFVSCPTCGRASKEVIPFATELEDVLSGVKKDITVAVMGCPVNGPGEAKEADVAVIPTENSGLIYKNGILIDRVENQLIIKRVLEIIDKL